MMYTAATTEPVGAGRSAARKARAALVAGLVAVGLLLPVLVAGSVATPADAAEGSHTFTVTRIDDRADANPGDGICSITTTSTGPFCTLRAAIQEANSTPEPDTINFAISAGGGVVTIAPSSPLPDIRWPVTIDGYTQQGAQQNTLTQGTNAQLKIELSGVNAGTNADGLNFESQFGEPSGSVVRGLVINRFSGAGIRARLDTSTLPTLDENQGIDILGNFIGTDPTGTLDRGNGFAGVFIPTKDHNFHLKNSTIGNSTQGRNLISGNDGDGVLIVPPAGGDAGSGFYVVNSNLIGTDRNGTAALGNSGNGVTIRGSSGNSVQSNTVAFNGQRGVSIEVVASSLDDADDNRILSNSIFSNGALGIDLKTLQPPGPTPNDLLDPDHGGNGLQNFPVLTSARTSGGKTTVKGTLNSAPGKPYLIQFFSNPSGGDEGKVFIGQKTVTTDATTGNATFGFQPAQAVASGRTVTATATLSVSGAQNTSEFSALRTVTKR
jgi:CSLREA domain-containing protein